MYHATRAMLLAILVLTACAATRADAQQLYKWLDKDGKVSYSDQPPPKDAKDVRQKGYGDNVTPSDELPFSVKEAMKRNPVTLFSFDCGDPCDKARALLNTRGIPFADRNPQTDPTAMDALKEATGAQSVPTLTLGTRVLKGFAESEWHDALTSSGYPRTNPGIRAKPVAPPTPAAPATTATPAPVK